MGRIRTIKPEFPQSESVGRLTRDARLLFIQLWTIADDGGRARAASRALASLLYPYDDDAPKLIDGWLDELEREKCIRRYVADGSTYLEIVKWLEHQKIDRPSQSRLPPFVECSRAIVEPSTTDLGPRTLDQGPRTESRARARATVEQVQKLFEEFWAEYPARGGGNPKTPAMKAFVRTIATGKKHEVDETAAAAVIGGAKRYAAECQNRGKAGTEYVAQAVTWLNQRRWEDYPEKAEQAADMTGTQLGGKVFVAAGSPEAKAWDRYLLATKGEGFPSDRKGVWCDSLRPPAEPNVGSVHNSTAADEIRVTS